MENGDNHEDEEPSSTHHFIQRVGEGVDLPASVASAFNAEQIAVLGAIRDAAYNTDNNTCTLSIRELARLVDVHPSTVARAITVGIAAGVIERDGNNLVNRGISYKVG